jgi:DNA (cytosine-5)-methyltransferase 1
MITIGTDCSGIEAPIEALKQLGIPFKHMWSCEINKFARTSILANHKPEILYEDITTRDHSQLPDVDVYVCGFPCQSFSLMGKKLGTQDPRSNIMMHCIDVIKKKQPLIFVLENVKNFKYIEKGKPFNYLLDALYKNVDETGETIYNIYWDIYNTKDYGIPQNRERIYIIGIKKDIQIKDFVKPDPIEMKPLGDFIIDKTIVNNTNISKTISLKLKRINFEKNYILCCDGISPPMKGCCPTLTYSGCKYMYHSTYNRYLSIQECLLLQGFPIDFKNVVGDVKLCNQIGNSMSVNVLTAIFKEILSCTVFNEF